MLTAHQNLKKSEIKHGRIYFETWKRLLTTMRSDLDEDQMKVCVCILCVSVCVCVCVKFTKKKKDITFNICGIGHAFINLNAKK